MNGPFRSSTHSSAWAHVSLCMFWFRFFGTVHGISGPPHGHNSGDGFLTSVVSQHHQLQCQQTHTHSHTLNHIVGTSPGNVVSKIKDLYPFWKIRSDLCPSNEERVVTEKSLALPRQLGKIQFGAGSRCFVCGGFCEHKRPPLQSRITAYVQVQYSH